MKRMRHACENLWADYCWLCDRSRWDEALALVGALTVAAFGLWTLNWLVAIGLGGNQIYGVPLLFVAHAAWRHRTR